jgi:hypothetical protein
MVISSQKDVYHTFPQVFNPKGDLCHLKFKSGQFLADLKFKSGT